MLTFFGAKKDAVLKMVRLLAGLVALVGATLTATIINNAGQDVIAPTVTRGAKMKAIADIFDKGGSIGGAVKDGGVGYMRETGNTVLLLGVGDQSASIAGVAGTITLNSGSGVVGSGMLGGLKL